MATAASEDTNINIGRVVQRGLETISRSIGSYLLLALLLAGVPAFLMELLVRPGTTNMLGVPSFSPLLIVGFLVSLVCGYLLQATLTRSAILDLSGRPADVQGSLGQAIKLVLPLIGLSILTSFAVGFGLLLLIVPGIILYVMLAVSVPVLVEERRGVVESMRRSAELTKGSRWRIFALMLLFMAVYMVLAAVVGVVAVLGESLGSITVGLTNSLVTAVTGLLAAAMLASLYVELKTVKEGATSESLASIFA